MNSYATTLGGPTGYYAAQIVAGIGAGGVYGTCIGNALKWFPDKRGLAAGLTAAGFGAGSALTVAPIENMRSRAKRFSTSPFSASQFIFIRQPKRGSKMTFFWFGLWQGVIVVALAASLLRSTRSGESAGKPGAALQ